MMKLIARDKVTGAEFIENYAYLDKNALCSFLVRLGKPFGVYDLNNIQFWFETVKNGSITDFRHYERRTG